MLTFFRRLRKGFLKSGAVRKYLLYAIGEIALVVIGILIALQINNWNLNRIKKDKEIEMLKILRSELQEGLSEFNLSLTQYGTAKKSINILLDQFDKDQPYNDSLNQHFFNTALYWGTSDLTNSAYETLKTIGIDLISNQKLRKSLALVYDENDSWIKTDENRYIDLLIDAGKNIFNTRFEDYWNGFYEDGKYVGEMIPLSYDNLKNDQEYHYFLRSLRNQMKWLIEEPIQSTQKEVVNLIETIDDELAVLE